MKILSMHVRSVVAAISLAGLAACGGSESYTISGTVTGLTFGGLTLSNSGEAVTVAANAASFVFSQQIGYGKTYEVSITTQPQHLSCILSRATGTAGTTSIGAIVTCTPNTYQLGGTISGLTTAGLVLTNGSDTVSPAANSTAFIFPANVADTAVYGVAVLTQPPGLTCSVSNGTAVMGAADVSNVLVTCR